jgi:hypothetical protein
MSGETDPRLLLLDPADNVLVTMTRLAAGETLMLEAPTRTRDEPVANSNSGNGTLRPETFDLSRRQ